MWLNLFCVSILGIDFVVEVPSLYRGQISKTSSYQGSESHHSYQSLCHRNLAWIPAHPRPKILLDQAQVHAWTKGNGAFVQKHPALDSQMQTKW